MALNFSPPSFRKERLAAVPGFDWRVALGGVAGMTRGHDVVRLVKAVFGKRENVLNG
jgi:hypothetical protein